MLQNKVLESTRGRGGSISVNERIDQVGYIQLT